MHLAPIGTPHALLALSCRYLKVQQTQDVARREAEEFLARGGADGSAPPKAGPAGAACCDRLFFTPPWTPGPDGGDALHLQ